MKKVLYLSAEFAISDDLPMFAGGLGVLAGDILKTATDIGYPLTGLGLFYRHGYFRQFIKDGRQVEEFPEYTPKGLGLEYVGAYDIPLPALGGKFRVWRYPSSDVNLFMLDSADSPWVDALDMLYTPDRRKRLLQEILLGFGAGKLVWDGSIRADVIHMNEGHSAFVGLYLLWKMVSDGVGFEEALRRVRRMLAFTTHTPVPAGNEMFDYSLVKEYLLSWWQSVGLSEDELRYLGGVDTEGAFSMTVLALRLSGVVNAVSQKHREVSQNMWRHIRDDIIAITNGVHVPTWAPTGVTDGLKSIDRDYKAHVDDENLWERFLAEYGEKLGHLKMTQKRGLLKFIADRFGIRWPADVFVAGFARRFATYKRANLMFKEPDRLEVLFGKGLRLVMAGKAHPADEGGKGMLAEILALVRSRGWEEYVVFIPDYGMRVAKRMLEGCDLWINNPIPPLEASGTSGQKAVLGGTLNLSVLDGWWIEGYDGWNGFGWTGYGDDRDAVAELALLEHAMSLRNTGGWWQMVSHAYLTLAPKFSSVRMFRDYIHYIYDILPSAME